jgi:hypothetical protein
MFGVQQMFENSRVTCINDMKELSKKCFSIKLYLWNREKVVTMTTVIEALSSQKLAFDVQCIFFCYFIAVI